MTAQKMGHITFTNTTSFSVSVYSGAWNRNLRPGEKTLVDTRGRVFKIQAHEQNLFLRRFLCNGQVLITDAGVQAKKGKPLASWRFQSGEITITNVSGCHVTLDPLFQKDIKLTTEKGKNQATLPTPIAGLRVTFLGPNDYRMVHSDLHHGRVIIDRSGLRDIYGGRMAYWTNPLGVKVELEVSKDGPKVKIGTEIDKKAVTLPR